ncbi:hypothetical protein [Plasmodium yoelii yoelii]|uniref:Uncharacterized protein n=1 Tax=Plasmodium yoelii yoelii TaxID=73239 RepID=Q7RCX2_PLAYO|nr:hypothetical protein [Plasmodium yoelii yoelii]
MYSQRSITINMKKATSHLFIKYNYNSINLEQLPTIQYTFILMIIFLMLINHITNV